MPLSDDRDEPTGHETSVVLGASNGLPQTPARESPDPVVENTDPSGQVHVLLPSVEVDPRGQVMQRPSKPKVPASQAPTQGSPIVLVNPAKVFKSSIQVQMLLPAVDVDPAGHGLQ